MIGGMIRGLLLTLALATPAGAFELNWPLACTLGKSCYIQHYVDRDPGPEDRDFTCGTLSYDGHDGTDIGLPNRAAMAAGVAVLAAAPGKVRGIRDGIADFLPPVPGKECGNGVLIEDGDGWQTQYCHMKQGSVAVRPGDEITVGQTLGLVGQSGAADFPHLHLTLRHKGAVVDPFAPDQASCGPTASPGLWANPLPYQPGGFLSAGFSAEVPQFDAIKAGLATPSLPRSAPALVLWAEVYGGQAGDELRFAIASSRGEVMLQTTSRLERTQDLLFRAAGSRLHEDLTPGTYAGSVRLLRKGVEVDRIATKVTVD